MVEEISLECKNTDILLLHCLDNQVFYVMDEETGGMAFPVKGIDEKYHASGKVMVAKDLPLENLLEKLEPLLRWGSENLKLLVMPVAGMQSRAVRYTRGTGKSRSRKQPGC
jgi:hypothetical protein